MCHTARSCPTNELGTKHATTLRSRRSVARSEDDATQCAAQAGRRVGRVDVFLLTLATDENRRSGNTLVYQRRWLERCEETPCDAAITPRERRDVA